MKYVLSIASLVAVFAATGTLLLTFERTPNLLLDGPLPTRVKLLLLHYIMAVLTVISFLLFPFQKWTQWWDDFYVSVWAKANYRIDICRHRLRMRGRRHGD